MSHGMVRHAMKRLTVQHVRTLPSVGIKSMLQVMLFGLRDDYCLTSSYYPRQRFTHCSRYVFGDIEDSN